MTVIHVMGCGVQKGNTRYYRGVKLDDIVLLPKIKLEIVVSKVPVQTVVDTARKVLYTGNIGDGKSLFMMWKTSLRSVPVRKVITPCRTMTKLEPKPAMS